MKPLDWIIVGFYFLFMVAIGLYFVRRASRSVADYFVSGRNLPWWIIALSAVATYSDAGIAPAVTMLTFQGGLLGNAVWWIPYVIWMPLGAVLWSKYWRRLGTVTSAELLNIRYGGRFASAYRGVYAIFMTVFIVLLMGYVSGWLGVALGPILGWEPMQLILLSALVAAVYTTISGLYGVAYTDAYQFGIFLVGNIILVPIVLSAVGGMEQVYQMIETTRGAEGAESFFEVLPPVKGLDVLTIFAFAVQGLFFAASPTGGEGFTAQRFMAARNEFHAQVGQLFNAVLTLVLRVVPFLFLGLIAAALYTPGSVAEPGEIWGRLVNSYAPTGLLGLLVAGIFAAYMSTISTEMNWGASYIVNDFYKPFIRQNESEKHYVLVGRIGSLVIFAASLLVTYYFVHGMRSWFLFINSVVFAFILPLSWLRFFWWRLNIYGEAAALIIGLPLSYIIWFPLGFSDEQAHPFWQGFLLLFGLGSAVIILVTLLTPPESIKTLKEFYRRCRPPGFWGPVVKDFEPEMRVKIRKETMIDLIDCGLGIAFCTSAILAVVSPLGKHWNIFIIALLAGVLSGGLFIFRWSKRGVFRSLRSVQKDEEDLKVAEGEV